MTSRALLIRIPTLERIAEAVSQWPPCLEAVLTKGRYLPGPAAAAIAGSIGSSELPAAAPLSLLGSCAESGPGNDDWWLRADVVRMVPDLSAVWVDRPLSADLAGDAMAPVRRDLDAMFAAEGLEWTPEPGAPYALLRLPGPPDCRFVDRDSARGRRLDDVLPVGNEASRWRSLINESQMIFHQFRSLDRPDQLGAGLWFWGAGPLPEAPRPQPDLHVIGRDGDALARGLARWLGARHEALSSFEQIDTDGIRLLRWRPDADGASWEDLERDWLAPAQHALRRGRLRELTVIGDAGAWHYRRFSRWARWRSNQRFVNADSRNQSCAE